MKTNFKKVLAVIITVLMVVSLFQITAFAEEYPELKLDSPVKMKLTDESGYITFTPEKTGKYLFYSDCGDDPDPCLDEICKGEEWVDKVYGATDDFLKYNFHVVYALTGGEKYTLRLRDLSETGEEFTVSVKEHTIPASIGQLKLNQTVKVPSIDEYRILTFTPEEDGVYSFVFAAIESEPDLGGVFDSKESHAEEIGSDYHDNYIEYVYMLFAGNEYRLAYRDILPTENGVDIKVEKSCGIDENPNEANPELKVYNPNDVKGYQWYELTGKTEVITDQEAKACDEGEYGEVSFDSATKVWTVSDSEYSFFQVLELDAQVYDAYTLEIVSGDIYKDSIYLESTETHEAVYFYENSEGQIELEIEEEDKYRLVIYAEGATISVKLTRERFDRSPVANQTSGTLTDFEEGKLYGCEATYKNGKKVISLPVAPKIVVLKQPNASDLSVKLNTDEVDKYQWYKKNVESILLTDKNTESAEGYISMSNPPAVSFDSKTGLWKCDGEENSNGTYTYGYFVKEFAKGDKVVVEASKNSELFLLNVSGGSSIASMNISKKHVFEVEETGKYLVLADSSFEDLEIKATLRKHLGDEKLEGQTTNTLTSYVRGGEYYCEISLSKGRLIETESVIVGDVITHQPTAKEPFVEVNFPKEVKNYRWYEAEGEIVPIDETTAKFFNPGNYNKENGKWELDIIESSDGEYSYACFMIELKKGETLTVISDNKIIWSHLYNFSGNSGQTVIPTIEENVLQYTATKDGAYDLTIATNSAKNAIRAYKSNMKLGKELAGQNSKKLTSYEKDKYYVCVVEYNDGVRLETIPFKANAQSPVTIPAAGNNSNILLWLALAVISSTALAGMTVYKKGKAY